MITSMFRVFCAGLGRRACRLDLWMDHVARRGLAASGALAGLVALAGTAVLPAPATAQGDFECGADQIEVPFGLTETVEMWEVPAGVDELRVIAAGGRGQADKAEGGAGALVAGTFPVTPGAMLHIIVAGQGGTGPAGGGAGGGGSFVGVGGFSHDEGELLLVAGGGGGGGGIGAGGDAGLPGSDGDPGGGPGGGEGGSGTGTGGSGGCGASFCGGGGGGATAGSHGANGNDGGGGGGAGGNGGDASGGGGQAAINGGAGGDGSLDDNDGGFGGGGGGSGGPQGAGGGGFAGGGGGGGFDAGGGGGSSFVVASVEDEASAPYTGGDGFVTLCYEEPLSPPSFGKSFSPASIVPGETSTLTFTIDNTGSATDAEDLAFTDALPTGVTVADAASPTDGCAGTLIAPPEADTIEYTGGTVAAGASCTVSVDVTSATPGAHENTSSELTSSAGTSDPAQATLEVTEVTTDFEVETATGTGTATGSISDGGPGCAVAGVEALAVEEVVPEGPPPEVELPHGLIALELTGCEDGASVEVTLNLPPEPPLGSQYWKYGPTQDQEEPHWYALESAAISGSTVTFTLVDGGAGDGDLTVDGTIVDPGGPAGVPPVPALPRLALVLLLALLAWAATWTLHRRRLDRDPPAGRVR